VYRNRGTGRWIAAANVLAVAAVVLCLLALAGDREDAGPWLIAAHVAAVLAFGASYRGGVLARRRDIGSSVYEGIAEDIDTPIVRGPEPPVTEGTEEGFAR